MIWQKIQWMPWQGAVWWIHISILRISFGNHLNL
jgi:hypothetical protein